MRSLKDLDELPDGHPLKPVKPKIGRPREDGREKVITKYGKNLPQRIRERYEAYLQNPGYVELREEIALVSAEVDEYNDRLARGDNPEWREQLQEALKENQKALKHAYDGLEREEGELYQQVEELRLHFGLDTTDDEERDRLLKEMEPQERQVWKLTNRLYNAVSGQRSVLESQLETAEACLLVFQQQQKIDDNYQRRQTALELLRKLKETEVRRMVAANQVLTIPESHALIVRLSELIEEHLTDPDHRTRAVREIAQLMERRGSMPALLDTYKSQS